MNLFKLFSPKNRARRPCSAALAAVLILSVALTAAAAPSSPTDHAFNYTITATGTENVTTYPEQSFTWTVTTTGTETWWEYGNLGYRTVSISGLWSSWTHYLYPLPRSTITGWRRTVHSSGYGGGDRGTYIDTYRNRLVIRVWSGGELYLCGFGSWCVHNGHYHATYYIQGNRQRTATVSRTQSGPGTVDATDDTKVVGTFSPAAPSPQHHGTVAVNNRTVSDDNGHVATSLNGDGSDGRVYASTDNSEPIPQAWSGTEDGSGTVNANEGDKHITDSTLAAPNHDTTWSVADDNDRVETWMTGNKLYAKVLNEPPDCSNASPSVDTLWPANHKFVSVEVVGVTDPDGDSVTITVDSIWQDEPVDSEGDGSHTPDGQGVGTSTARVRTERQGGGNGRVYHITFTAADDNGGTCSSEVLVSVPHDKKKPAVDEGSLYDSTIP